MKKLIKTSALFIISAIILTFLAACGNDDYVLISGDKKYPVEPYAFYSYYYRDTWATYLYSYLKTEDLSAYLDKPASEDGQTLEQLIVNQTKEQYISYIIITNEFERLNLSLTDEMKKEIDQIFEKTFIGTYSENELDNICKTLNLTKDEIKDILSVNYKRQMIIDYYFGEGGSLEISEEAIKSSFENDYARFKYIVFAKQDESGNSIPTEDTLKKYNLSKELIEKLNSGENFIELMKEYSEAYIKDTSELGETEKEAAENLNKILTEDGLIVKKDGTILQEYYSGYDSVLDSELVNKVFSLKNGEFAEIETDSGFWIVQRCDINESEKYYNDSRDIVFDYLLSEPYTELFNNWKSDFSYTMNDKIVEKYNPKNISALFFNKEKLDAMNDITDNIESDTEK